MSNVNRLIAVVKRFYNFITALEDTENPPVHPMYAALSQVGAFTGKIPTPDGAGRKDDGNDNDNQDPHRLFLPLLKKSTVCSGMANRSGSFLCSHNGTVYAKKKAYFIESGGLHDGIQTTTAAA